jgi:hypothetical protein
MNPWDDVTRLVGGIIWYTAWRQQDQARGVRLWAEGVNAFRASISASKWTAAKDIFKKQEQDEWNLHWRFYDQWRYQMSIPDFPRATTWGPENLFYDAQRLFQYETRREMTIAAIAIKRFEIRHSLLPPDLSALLPEFLSELPRDYMNGKPLRYKLNPDGTFLLYSVGEDGIDNGGDPTHREGGRIFFPIWDGCDAVWPVAATQQDVEAWEASRQKRNENARIGGRGRGITAPTRR